MNTQLIRPTHLPRTRVIERDGLGLVELVTLIPGYEYSLVRVKCDCCPSRRPWYGYGPLKGLRKGDHVLYDTIEGHFRNMHSIDNVRKVSAS